MAAALDAKEIVLSIIDAVEQNKAWLSEIDGAVGDGDHGINMAKGFAMVKQKLESADNNLAGLMKLVGMTLLANIGGAMGPIYGTFFINMGKAVQGKESIGKGEILEMLSSALEGVKQRGGAEVGEKTLVDALEPAVIACRAAVEGGADAYAVVERMIEGAKAGMEKTKDLVAKKGRSSRLGERSRGTIDAGAASCYVILKAYGQSLKKYL